MFRMYDVVSRKSDLILFSIIHYDKKYEKAWLDKIRKKKDVNVRLRSFEYLDKKLNDFVDKELS